MSQPLPQTIVVVDDSCPVCTTVKKDLAPAVKKGKVKLVRDGTKKAKEILQQVPIKYVPECVREVSPGKFERCDIEKLIASAKAGKL